MRLAPGVPSLTRREHPPEGSVPDPPRDRWNVTPKRVLLGEQLLKNTTPRLTAYYWEAIRA